VFEEIKLRLVELHGMALAQPAQISLVSHQSTKKMRYVVAFV
jgi:hypothetical protein